MRKRRLRMQGSSQEQFCAAQVRLKSILKSLYLHEKSGTNSNRGPKVIDSPLSHLRRRILCLSTTRKRAC